MNIPTTVRINQRLTIVGATLIMSACASATTPPATTMVAGRVAFPHAYQAQATTTRDIGLAATVSLIDPADGHTITTTLTHPDGSFTLLITGFKPQTQSYLVEAVKGLSSNQAGHDAARLRTLVRYDGGAWQTLTGQSANLNETTTALCAIAAARALPVDPMIGRVTEAGFEETGTGIARPEFTKVLGLVNLALASDLDPVSGLVFDGTSWMLTDSGAPPFLSAASPSPAVEGASLTLTGGNFRLPPSANAVSIGSLPLAVATGDAQTLVVTVPVGARTGTLTLTTPSGAASLSLTVLPIVTGDLLPNPEPSLPPGDIMGELFGR